MVPWRVDQHVHFELALHVDKSHTCVGMRIFPCASLATRNLQLFCEKSLGTQVPCQCGVVKITKKLGSENSGDHPPTSLGPFRIETN